MSAALVWLNVFAGLRLPPAVDPESFNRFIPDYSDTKGFRREMFKLARDLEKVGL